MMNGLSGSSGENLGLDFCLDMQRGCVYSDYILLESILINTSPVQRREGCEMISKKLPVADTWYGVESYPGGITRLYEKHIDPYESGTIWMVSGSDRNLIVDSGTGIMPPGPAIAAISDKPLVAVALCHFYDHAGGMYSFEERACHHLEARALANPPGDWIEFEFNQHCRMSALPYADFDIEDYAMKSAPPTQLLEDGQLIDLGDRKFEVLHIPGRTPGSIAVWEQETGYLFGGETLFIDPQQRDFPPQDNSLYESSLHRLARLPVTTVFGGHYGSFSREELHQLISREIGRYA